MRTWLQGQQLLILLSPLFPQLLTFNPPSFIMRRSRRRRRRGGRRSRSVRLSRGGIRL